MDAAQTAGMERRWFAGRALELRGKGVWGRGVLGRVFPSPPFLRLRLKHALSVNLDIVKGYLSPFLCVLELHFRLIESRVEYLD